MSSKALAGGIGRLYLCAVAVLAVFALPAAAEVTVHVESTGASSVPISGTTPGTTPYDAAVSEGSTVTLVAPSGRAGGYIFDRWEDGLGTVLSRTTSVTATVNVAMTLKAVYGYYTTVYYVNDSSFAEAGSLCSAAGNDANDGLAPGRPKATVQAIINAYGLGASNVVWIDPGAYSQTFAVTSNDVSARFVGAGSDRTVFSVPNGATGFHANGYTARVEEMAFAGGGVGAAGVLDIGGSDGVVSRCRVTGMTGDGITVQGSPAVRECVVENNGGNGFVANGSNSAALGGNTANNNAGMAYRVGIRTAVRSAGNGGSGNGVNAFLIATGDSVWNGGGTLCKQPLDYRVRNTGNYGWIYAVGSTSAAIDPGVTMAFEGGTGLYVQGNNSWGSVTLNVNGALGQPVLFTSAAATPAAGDWMGIKVENSGYATTLNMTYGTVEYAGGSSDGGLGIYGSGVATLSDCILRNNAGHGLLIHSGSGSASQCLFQGNTGTGARHGFGGAQGFTLTGNVSRNNSGPAYYISANMALASSGNSGSGNGTDRIVIGTAYRFSSAGTLPAQPLPYGVNNNGASGWLTVGGVTVDFAAGTQLYFDSGTGVYVVGNGTWGTSTLRVNGSAGAPALFTSSAGTPAPGNWMGFRVEHSGYSTTLNMTHATVEYGGGSAEGGMGLYGNCTTTLANSTLRHNAGHGLYIHNATGSADQSVFQGNGADGVHYAFAGGASQNFTVSNNVSQNNAGRAFFLSANMAAAGGGNSGSGNGTDGIVIGTLNRFSANGTLTLQGLPYRVEKNNADGWLTVGGATVDFAAGTQLYFDSGTGLYVVGNGTWGSSTLRVNGTSGAPALLTSSSGTPVAGNWRGIKVEHSGYATTLNMTYGTVEYAGGSGEGGVELYGACATALGNSTLRHNAGHGLYVHNATGSADQCVFQGNGADGFHYAFANGASQNFTVSNNVSQNNAGRAFRLSANMAVASTGNSGSGNGTDRIVVGTLNRFSANGTLTLQGLPYAVEKNNSDGWLQVGGATVDVTAGAQIAFGPGAGIYVLGNGAWGSSRLNLNGASGAPVLLTSQAAVPARGDWLGLKIENGGATGALTVTHTTLEYGGGSGDGGLALYGTCSATLSNATVRNNAGHGLFIHNGSGSASQCIFEGNAADGASYNFTSGALQDFPFSNNISRNNGARAFFLCANMVVAGAGNTGSGNGTDRIVIGTAGRVSINGALAAQGMPYGLLKNSDDGWLYVGGATLDVAAGAQVLCGPGSGIYVLGNGTWGSSRMNLNGTAANPVLFTSSVATPAPGDWKGIRVESSGYVTTLAATSAAIEFADYGVYSSNGTVTLANMVLRRCNNGVYTASNIAALFTNCLVHDCVTYGIWHSGEDLDIRNATISRNGTGLCHTTGDVPYLRNSIVWNNPTPVAGMMPGRILGTCIDNSYYAGSDGNINLDPLFVNAAGGDFHLAGYSPCIDAATADFVPATDLAGNARYDDANVAPNGALFPDMGVYEAQTDSTSNVIYVNDGVTGEAGSLCSAAGNDANHGYSRRLPMRTIQGALNKYPDWAAGKSLWIDPGTFGETVIVAASHAGLKIQGAGAGRAIVDGGQANTVFILNSFGAGELSGLTIQNGKAAGATALEKSGGGVRVNGASTALLANLVLKNNAAGSGSGGGGVYTYNASPVIRNCLVYSNTGSGCGGIRTFNGAVTITNCTVANNTGGGIHRTGTGTLAITNSIAWANGDDLIGCAATYSCIEDGDAGTGNISGNPLFANAAARDYQLTVGSPCIDSADTAAAPATDLAGVARQDDPGILPNGGAPADMGAREFTGTTIPQTLYVNDASTSGDVYCTAIGNDANTGFWPNAPMRTIQALLNKYPGLPPRTVVVDTGTYAENLNVTAAHAGWKLRGAGAERSVLDGGLANTVVRLTGFGSGEISGFRIQNGKATGATALEKSGGGIRCYSGSNPLIADCIIRNNAAGTGSGGGGIYAYSSSPTIRSCVVAKNTGTGCGGIRTFGGAVTITNCTVANNVGGGIHKTGTGTLAITNSIAWTNGDDLISCAATYSCIEDGDAGTGNIAGNPLFVNAASGDYRLTAGSPCIDSSNSAAAPATDVIGTARRDDPGTLPNGSVFADMGAYEFTGVTVPPVLYVNDESTAGDLFCAAAGDDANTGLWPEAPMRHIQALLAKYPAVGSARTIKIDTGTYAENVEITAAHAGWKLQGAGAAGTVVDGGQVNSVFRLTAFGAGELSGMTVRNGKATGATALEKSGGGIRCYSGSNPLIAECIVRNNAAGSGSGGGGIYTYNSSPTIRNCVVDHNTGTGNGGIRTYGGTVSIMNCTVANNAVSGIHKTGTGTLTITNSIVWANGDDLMSCTATYSCIEDGDAGTGNISGNPFFINPASGDYHLDPASPCINTGTATGAPATDLDGTARDATPDMGAYEYGS